MDGELRSGTVPKDVAVLVARFERSRSPARVRALGQEILAALPTVSDEPFLRACLDLIDASPVAETLRLEFYRALLDQACSVARARGASWTPLVDRVVMVLADGPMAVLPTEAQEAYVSAVAALGHLKTQRQLRVALSMKSEPMQRAVALHTNAARLSARGFATLVGTQRPELLWCNRRLTPAQRQLLIDRVSSPVMTLRRLGTWTSSYAFLDSFTSTPAEAGPVPTHAQLVQLATSLAARLRANHDGRVLVRTREHVDICRLLAVPRLPWAAMQPILAQLPVVDTRIHAFSLLSPFVRQPATPAKQVLEWFDALGTAALEKLGEALLTRPDLMAHPAIRGAIRRAPQPPLELLHGIALANPDAELVAVLQLFAKRAPTHAATLLDRAIESGVSLTREQLLPLLESRHQKLRMRAVMAVAMCDVASGGIEVRRECDRASASPGVRIGDVSHATVPRAPTG